MLPQHRSSHFGEVKPQGHFDGRHSFNTLTQMKQTHKVYYLQIDHHNMSLPSNTTQSYKNNIIVVKTFKISFLSSFQICNTILLTQSPYYRLHCSSIKWVGQEAIIQKLFSLTPCVKYLCMLHSWCCASVLSAEHLTQTSFYTSPT